MTQYIHAHLDRYATILIAPSVQASKSIRKHLEDNNTFRTLSIRMGQGDPGRSEHANWLWVERRFVGVRQVHQGCRHRHHRMENLLQGMGNLWGNCDEEEVVVGVHKKELVRERKRKKKDVLVFLHRPEACMFLWLFLLHGFVVSFCIPLLRIVGQFVLAIVLFLYPFVPLRSL